MDSPAVEAGIRCSSITVIISLQISDSSDSTFCLYSLIRFAFCSFPLTSSFCSIDDRILQEALRAPITFLYPTESKFRSSTVKSTSSFATFFIASTISAQNFRKKSEIQLESETLALAKLKQQIWKAKEETLTVVSLGLLSELSYVDEVLASHY